MALSPAEDPSSPGPDLQPGTSGLRARGRRLPPRVPWTGSGHSDHSDRSDWFVGRERERRLLARALGADGGGPVGVAVVGAAGIGKTALVDTVADEVATRRAARVVRVCGLESEAALPYAAAADLLVPLRARFGSLPANQRRALEVALALDDGAPANLLATCAGALGVLVAATDERPLVVVVDDLQWVDPESARLFRFAARRLTGERAVMLLAGRAQPGAAPPAPGLPTLCLAGLGVRECRELARRRGLDAADEVLCRVVAAAEGNPRAVLEILAGRRTRRDQEGGPVPAGSPGPAYGTSMRRGHPVLRHRPEPAGDLLAPAIMSAAMAGDLDGLLAAARRNEETGPWRPRPSWRNLVLGAYTHVLAGAPEARSRIARVNEILPEGDPAVDGQALACLAQCRSWIEDDDGARVLATAAVDNARQVRAPEVLAFALSVRSEVELRSGHWADADADAAQSLRWARTAGDEAVLGYSALALAGVDAARGERARVEEHLDTSRRDLGGQGPAALRVFHSAVLGRAALGDGDPEAAVEHLETAWILVCRSGLGNPNVVPFVADLVEANLRCGWPERAREPLAWLEERGAVTGLAGPQAAAARCRGLLATDPDDAAAAFARARSALAGRPAPFEVARTLLCEGEVSRRGRRPAAARAVLQEALTGFEALGARPWARRAAAELAATGVRPTAPSRYPEALDSLTPQELQIARMVASGRNNIEAAAALFVSRKTVEAHLTRVYRKLSVRSRTELAAVLARHGPLD